MIRIDAHQHCWQLAARTGQWPPASLAQIHRDFAPADLAPLLAQHGIATTVLVQSLPSATDTRFLLELADATAFIGGVVGWVDLKAPDAAAQIALVARHPKLKGLRPMLQDLDDDDWIADPQLARAVAAMQAHGLTLDALVLPRHLPALLEFARMYPALPVVIDHAAKPPIASGDAAAMEAWRTGLARLAALPQVSCKLSGLVTEAGPSWDVALLRPFVEHVLGVFGAHRVLWSSDWPVLNLASDYAGWIAASEQLLAYLDDADRERIFGLNARRFYRLD